MKEIYKTGDRVWYVGRGWGKVTGAGLTGDAYPIKVAFGEDTLNFTREGKFCQVDKFPSLFFQEIEISKEALERPRWRAEKGEYFFFVNVYGELETATDYRDKWCNRLFVVGNYFQTKEEAMESKYYKVFHD